MDASTEVHSTFKGLCCLDVASHLIPLIAVFNHQLVLAPFYRGGSLNTGSKESSLKREQEMNVRELER